MGESMEACPLVDTVRDGLIGWPLSETGRVSVAQNLVLFQSDFISPSVTPPPKKIKMYFMKLLYMKHLLAVIKWTI